MFEPGKDSMFLFHKAFFQVGMRIFELLASGTHVCGVLSFMLVFGLINA